MGDGGRTAGPFSFQLPVSRYFITENKKSTQHRKSPFIEISNEKLLAMGRRMKQQHNPCQLLLLLVEPAETHRCGS